MEKLQQGYINGVAKIVTEIWKRIFDGQNSSSNKRKKGERETTSKLDIH